jgi:hypothetical protein
MAFGAFGPFRFLLWQVVAALRACIVVRATGDVPHQLIRGSIPVPDPHKARLEPMTLEKLARHN